MKHVFIAATFCLVGIAPSGAQTKLDILTIYQNFIASAVAQSKCGTPDKAVDAQFLSNLTTVTIRAAQTLKERNPTATDDALLTTMDSASDHMKNAVASEFNANGCQSRKMQLLLGQYQLHANTRLDGQ